MKRRSGACDIGRWSNSLHTCPLLAAQASIGSWDSLRHLDRYFFHRGGSHYVIDVSHSRGLPTFLQLNPLGRKPLLLRPVGARATLARNRNFQAFCSPTLPPRAACSMRSKAKRRASSKHPLRNRATQTAPASKWSVATKAARSHPTMARTWAWVDLAHVPLQLGLAVGHGLRAYHQ